MLGWFWVASAVTTIVLVVVTRAALREREYSAVMAATGLLYLAILTAFGPIWSARAVLAGLNHRVLTTVHESGRWRHAPPDLERDDQLRPGQHPGQAVQRRVAARTSRSTSSTAAR